MGMDQTQKNKVFDQETNRVEYCELLDAGEKYELEQAVCLTYSLDPEALAGVFLHLGQQGGDVKAKELSNPLKCVPILKELSSRVQVFCNRGSCKLPVTGNDKTKALYQLLLNRCVHEVSMEKENYNFHPKVWVLQYKDKKSDAKIMKLVVSSRNLTFDQDMDVSVALTGNVTGNKVKKNKSLFTMLKWVCDRIKTDAEDQNIKTDAEDQNKELPFRKNLWYTDFHMEESQFTDYAFHWFLAKKEADTEKLFKLFTYCEKLMVVSPFLAKGVLTKLLFADGSKPEQRCLITRRESLTKDIYDAWCKDGKGEIWVPKESWGKNIHAKIYYTEKDAKQKLYIGSLNATENAFEHNAETLLELDYKEQTYEQIREDLLAIIKRNGEEASAIFEKLETYEEITGEKEQQTKKVSELKLAAHAIVSATLSESADNCSIEVEGQTENQGLFEGVYIYPLGAGEDKKVQFHRKENEAGCTYIACIKNLQLREIGEWFLLVKQTDQMMIRIPVKGQNWKEAAEQAYIETIFDNARDMDAWMLRDICGVAIETNADEGGNGEEHHFGTEYASARGPYTWYEQLLRQAADNPEKLSERMDDWMKHGNKYGKNVEKRIEALNPLFELVKQVIGNKRGIE